MAGYSLLQKASIFAIKEESVSGQLEFPTAGTDFVPLRPGESKSVTLEEITNDEMKNDIGMSKPYTGIETVDCSFPAYLKPKGTAGFPNWIPFLKSSLGDSSSMASTDVTVAGTTASAIKVADASLYYLGQALLINGEIRNVVSIDTGTDVLTMNFSYSSIPANGSTIQKCYTIKPKSTDHPTYSVFGYTSNGGALVAVQGCKTKSVGMTLNSGSQAEVTFGYEGTKYFLNPIKITSTNKYLDIVDFNSDTVAVALTEKIYRSPDELAAEIQSKVSAATGEVFTCVFNSNGASAGKFTITDAAGAFSILWNTGLNAANSVGTTIGFIVAADDTGVATYTSDNVITYSSSLTPSYDSADSIIIKGNEFFLGSQTENFCRKASSLSLTIDTPITNVNSMCSESGVLEKLTTSRSVSLTATILLEKHQVALFTKMIQSSTTQAMINLGNVTNSQFQVGKSINLFLPNFSITKHDITGDDIVVLNLEGKGFVDVTALKDIYANFV